MEPYCLAILLLRDDDPDLRWRRLKVKGTATTLIGFRRPNVGFALIPAKIVTHRTGKI